MWLSIIAGHVCKGCGKLLDLALAPLVRKKKALDILQEAQALTDAEDIKSGKKNRFFDVFCGITRTGYRLSAHL